MVRQGVSENTAQFVYDQGWRVGTVLYGHAIVRNGVTVERSRTAIITAIGLDSVLAIVKFDGEDRWSRDGLIGFGTRDWEVLSRDPSVTAAMRDRGGPKVLGHDISGEWR